MRPDNAITDEKVRKPFYKLQKLLKTDDRLNQATIQLLNDICLLEQVKMEALKNPTDKTLGIVLRCIEQQRKLQNALKLPENTIKDGKLSSIGNKFF